MENASRVGAALAAGYLLGRMKKLRLAITVGGLLTGNKLPTNPRDLTNELQRLVGGNEALTGVSEQVRGQLLDAAKTAAIAAVTQRLGDLTNNIRGQADKAREVSETVPSTTVRRRRDEEEPEEEYAEASEEEEEEEGEPEDEYEPEPEPEPARRRPRTTAAKKSTGRGPVKKTAASKTTAKKTAAKKSTGSGPAKKTATKKTAAKKSAAKKSAS